MTVSLWQYLKEHTSPSVYRAAVSYTHLLVFQGVQILAVDHVLGDPQLLVHPFDHDALVHALVCTAEKICLLYTSRCV